MSAAHCFQLFPISETSELNAVLPSLRSIFIFPFLFVTCIYLVVVVCISHFEAKLHVIYPSFLRSPPRHPRHSRLRKHLSLAHAHHLVIAEREIVIIDLIHQARAIGGGVHDSDQNQQDAHD